MKPASTRELSRIWLPRRQASQVKCENRPWFGWLTSLQSRHASCFAADATTAVKSLGLSCPLQAPPSRACTSWRRRLALNLHCAQMDIPVLRSALQAPPSRECMSWRRRGCVRPSSTLSTQPRSGRTSSQSWVLESLLVGAACGSTARHQLAVIAAAGRACKAGRVIFADQPAWGSTARQPLAVIAAAACQIKCVGPLHSLPNCFLV